MIETIPEIKKQISHVVLIVTGLSGAGKTSVMRSLEDIGFYCVDNLPVPLITTFLTLIFHSHHNVGKIALGIDARGEQFLSNFIGEIQRVKKEELNCDLKIVFVNAKEQTILKRFQETRRKHPLADSISIDFAIEKEKRLMEPIMLMADMIFDTDLLNIHDLRIAIRTRFAENQQQELLVNLVSFGFKYGVPAESNLVYDLRFLPNPYFIPALRAHDGRNTEVQEYLFKHPEVQEYWDRLTDFLHYTINKYHQEGRFFVTIAIGCTGGKHRSVTFVEKLHNMKWANVRFLVTHRDVGKE
jgi:UPF0042 nucleotide-binding protein